MKESGAHFFYLDQFLFCSKHFWFTPKSFNYEGALGDEKGPASTFDVVDVLLAQVTGHYNSSQSRKG